ncbi:MAG: lactate utilization protein [Synergistes sp.]|nr:lactate utilization protein [Synergistes sp.]
MDFCEAKHSANKVLAENVCKALEARGFHASFAKDAAAAREAALALIPDGSTVGIPGSVTVREIGLPEALKKKGCVTAEHWAPDMTKDERKKALLAELTSDWFVTSANALSMDGVIVNIDGTGNRTAAMSWGPGSIIYIIGVNKIALDVHSALKRARNQATPPNAMRLSRRTPCAVTGRCSDCSSDDRLCRVVMLLERAPIGRECHVIIVGEELGY